MRFRLKKEDLSLWVLSFVLAVLVWALVPTQPEVDVSRLPEWNFPIPVEIRGLSPHLTVSGVPSTVEVRVLAAAEDRREVERDLRAWVDLGGLGAGRHTVRLHVSAPVAGRVIGLEPLYAQVILEEKPADDEVGGKGEPGKPEAPEGVNGPGSPPRTGDSSSSLPARPAEPDRGRE